MASSTVIPKAVEKNNRRAFGDIANMIIKCVCAKSQRQFIRPVTCEELLVNGEAGEIIEGSDNKKKPAISADEVPDKVPERKVLIDEICCPDAEEANKESPASVSSANGGLDDEEETNKGQAVDIDAGDVKDLYRFYKKAESSIKVHDYMDSQAEITERMRMILVDWLIDVHYDYQLSPETLFLTVQIVDRYLSIRQVKKKELQLLGITSMLIASKYEEIRALRVNDCVYISAYRKKRVLGMERSILAELGWRLTGATPYGFLVRFAKAAMADKEMENMVSFLAELGLMQYSMVKFCPSMFAASAVYAARCILNKTPLWDETLELHTGYSESQLKDCAEQLMRFHSGCAENKANVVYRTKYSASEHCCGVALLKSAKMLMKRLRFWLFPS